MPTGIVGDERVRHAVRAKLEGGERGALIAGPGLVHPHMHFDAFVMGAVDGGERRSPIDGGEPARIAMGEDVDPFAAFLLGMGADQPEPVLAYSAVGLDILVADRGGAGESGGDALVARLVAHGISPLTERPAEIDGGGARGGERLTGPLERLVGSIVPERERHPVS